ncbi:MAG: phage portal protein [Planctomycetes bacterium]|nr:phage portal protein [Planctomycetota bacterium]
MNDFYNRAISLALEHTSTARTWRPADGQNRLSESNFQWDMYCGRQKQYVPRLPGESTAEFARRPHKQFLNVTRVIVDILGQLYRRPVKRELQGSSRLSERIRKVWQANAMDRLMLTTDRMARLHGVAAIRVSYQNDEVNYWPWPAHRIDVVPDPQRPDQALAVIALPAGDGGLAQVWTKDRYAEVANGQVVTEQTHDIGKIPFVFVHDRLPVDGFWVEGRGLSVAHANAEFNAKLSELGFTVAMQGFGVMEIVNPDPTREIAIGPARAIRFNVSGNEPFGVNFKSPNAPIADLISDLEFLLRTLLKTQRIPESVLSVHSGGNVSGASIVAQQTPVLEDRTERQAVFRAFEHQLLDTSIAVLAAHEGVTGKAELQLDFPEPELAQSATERMNTDDWRIQQGMTTPAEIMQRDNPDAFKDQQTAESVRKTNLKKNGSGSPDA